jgi:hypothetical protein
MLRPVQGNPDQDNATMMNWNDSTTFALSGKSIQRPRLCRAAARRQPLHSRDISANSLDGGLDNTLQSSLTKLQIQGTKFLSESVLNPDPLGFVTFWSSWIRIRSSSLRIRTLPLIALLWRSRPSELWPASSNNRYRICSKRTQFGHKYKKYLGSIFILSRRSNRPDSRTGRVEAKRRQR